MEYWKKEILAFVISVFYLTLIFSFEVGKGILPERIPLAFLVSLILFGTKIGLQKTLCSKLNLKGSLKVWNSGIFSGILLMIFGIKFALPSILEIKPFKFGRWGFKVSHLSYKEAGLISLGGILVPLLSLFLFKHVFNNFFLAHNIILLLRSWRRFFTRASRPPYITSHCSGINPSSLASNRQALLMP